MTTPNQPYELPPVILRALAWAAIALGLIGIALVWAAIQIALSGVPGRIDVALLLGLVIKALENYGKWVIDFYVSHTGPNQQSEEEK